MTLSINPLHLKHSGKIHLYTTRRSPSCRSPSGFTRMMSPYYFPYKTSRPKMFADVPSMMPLTPQINPGFTLYRLKSRWHIPHVLVYHGPSQIATFWEWKPPSILSLRCNWKASHLGPWPFPHPKTSMYPCLARAPSLSRTSLLGVQIVDQLMVNVRVVGARWFVDSGLESGVLGTTTPKHPNPFHHKGNPNHQAKPPINHN